ncbi:hypothetical protein GP475_11740 [Corynebacterium poyangense]|uniref:LGFP repeat-containing protein n=1 Tax=Corynebacterium poyangense TaxID=2684405 RepID=A0A7H0SRQ4_9CORY|nr:hypothetical protein [Corynebacterium poyangense]QNQ91229.1 hypothetical protein GP475_11740 [Corynebacterium poyangense]
MQWMRFLTVILSLFLLASCSTLRSGTGVPELNSPSPGATSSAGETPSFDPEFSPEVRGAGGIALATIAQQQQLINRALDQSPHTEQRSGQMRTDRVGVPEGIDKDSADRAERAEASQSDSECRVFWPSEVPVCGAIAESYAHQGGAGSVLLWPVEEAQKTADGKGVIQKFRNGFMVWTPSTGAYAMKMEIAQAWERQGWDTGKLGFPVAEAIVHEETGNLAEEPDQESPPPSGPILQEFQDGYIAWNSFAPAVVLGKEIGHHLVTQWHSEPFLGSMPISDEKPTEDGKARSVETNLGAIYFHPDHGVHEVKNLIYEVYLQNGAERGRYGYPVSDADEYDPHIPQKFEGGAISLPEELEKRGTSIVDGQEISNLLIDSLKRRGLWHKAAEIGQ